MTAPHPFIPIVCARYKMPLATFMRRSRVHEVMRARHLAMYLMHTKGGLPYQTIARLLNTCARTVSEACVALEAERADPKLDEYMRRLEEKVDALTPS